MKPITKHTSEEEILKRGECNTGKSCQPCQHLCKMGSGALAPEDIPNIAKFLGLSEEQLKEQYLEPITKFNTTLHRPKLHKVDDKPYGRCAFFDEERACTIHPVKPKECKVANCNDDGEALSLWFTLNHYVNAHDPQSVREFATYLETGGKTLNGATLKEMVPDKDLLHNILNHKVLR